MRTLKRFLAGVVAAVAAGVAVPAFAQNYTQADVVQSGGSLSLYEDSTLTISSEVSVDTLTLSAAEGREVTLTVAGSSTLWVVLGITLNEGVTLKLPDGKTFATGPVRTESGTPISGTGTVAFTKIMPDTNENWTAAAWKGTVWVLGLASQTNWNPTGFGNEHSTMRLSGWSGYLAKAKISVPFAIELENDSYDYGMNVSNGYSFNSNGGWSYFAAPKLKGTGTYKANTTGTQQLFVVTDDSSEFTGKFEMTGKSVWLGCDIPADETYVTGNTIVIGERGTLNWQTGSSVGSISCSNGGGTINIPYLGVTSNTLDIPGEVLGVLTNSAWRGTAVLGACTNETATAVKIQYPLGNANSKLVVKGLVPKNNDSANYNSFWFDSRSLPSIQLDGDMVIKGNGYSGANNSTVIPYLTGTGDFTLLTSLGSMTYYDVTLTNYNYTGTLGADPAKDCIRVSLVLEAFPTPGRKVINVDAVNNNVTIKALTIAGKAFASTDNILECKDGDEGYGWYYTAAGMPVSSLKEGASDPVGYWNIKDAVDEMEAGSTYTLTISASTSNEEISFPEGVHVTMDIGEGVTNAVTQLTYGAGAELDVQGDGRLSIPVGTAFPTMGAASAAHLYVTGSFGTGSTLFTYLPRSGDTGAALGTIATSAKAETRVYRDETANGAIGYFAGRRYYWASGETWADAQFWRYDDGSQAAEYPNSSDAYDGDYVIVTNATEIKIDSEIKVSRITIDADATLTGLNLGTSKGLWFDVMDGAGTVTLVNMRFAIIAAGSRAYTVYNNVNIPADTTTIFDVGNGSAKCSLYGNATGEGTLKISYGNSGALQLYGDNSGFCGEVVTEVKSAGNYNDSFIATGAASSKNALWRYTGGTWSLDVSTIRDASTYYFGALIGYLNAGNYNATFVIGDRDDVDSEYSITANGSNFNIVKVGSARATHTQSPKVGGTIYNKFASYEIQGGELVLKAVMPNAIRFTGDGGMLYTPTYLVTNIVEAVTNITTFIPDASAKIQASTAPVAFNTDGENFWWNTPLPATCTGGFIKDGAGTLYMTNGVPQYKGLTEVRAGILVVPFGTEFDSLILGDGAEIHVDMSTAVDGKIAFSSGRMISGSSSGIKILDNAPAGYSGAIKLSDSPYVIWGNGSSTLTWTGAAGDLNWSTPGNWSPSSSAPKEVDNVEFPSATEVVACTNAEDVVVLGITAPRGLELDIGFNIVVLKDVSIVNSSSEKRAFIKRGVGEMEINGTLKASTVTVNCGAVLPKAMDVDYIDVATSPLGGNLAVAKRGWNSKVKVPAARTWTNTASIKGRIEATGTQTFNNGGLNTSITGTLSGDMDFVKAGSGTLTLLGTNSFTGAMTISGGTLRLGNYIEDVPGLIGDYDAGKTETFEYVGSTPSTGVAKWYACAGVDDAPYFVSDGTAPVKSTYGRLGGHNGIQSNAFSMWLNKSARALASFFVYEPLETEGHIAHDDSSDRWQIVNSSSHLRAWEGANASATERPLWNNGVYCQSGDPAVRVSANAANVASAGFRFTADEPDVIGIGHNTSSKVGGKIVFGEVALYSRDLAVEEVKAVEAQLLSKWDTTIAGTTPQYKYRPIPATANVTLSGATLDLGGFEVDVASFTGSGVLTNGVLRTETGYLDVNGSLTASAMNDTTYRVTGGDTLTLLGTANGIEIDATELTAPASISTEIDPLDMTYHLPADGKWTLMRTKTGVQIKKKGTVINFR